MNLLTKLELASIVVVACAACAGSDQSSNPPQAPSPPTQTTGAAVPGAGTLTVNPTASAPSGFGVQTGASMQGGATVSGANVAAATSPTGSSTDPNTMLSDGQIGMIASDVDGAEIAAARLALTRAKSPKVRQFAQHMLTAHTNLEQKLQATLKSENIKPDDSQVSQKLMNDSQAQADTLRASTGSDFDHAYISGQITDHQQVLSMLDDKLIPNAKDPQLKTALEQTRLKVIDHIKMAQDVQSSLSP